ncbi:MAG: DinB superfamily protein [Saprospiraceae bacterium]|nr:DinB superfamily protein [Saprospiraceae bacterium]
MTSHLARLFERDLEALKREILAYANEQHLWVVDGGIANPAGNLALHLAGNLRHYIGAMLGNTGYIRDRHAEFHDRDVSRAGILEQIDLAAADIRGVLPGLTEEQLHAPFPQEVLGYPMSTQYFLIHLYGHFNYHLGQINYHRRLLSTLPR